MPGAAAWDNMTAGDDLVSIATVYDGSDHPTRITETSSTSGDRVTTQAWDQLGNLSRVETPEGIVTSTWDPAGNRTRMTDPSGKVTHYTYDARNRLSSVTLSGVGVAEYEYLRDGRIASIDRPNGVTTSYTYDGAGRVEEIEHAGAETVARTAYTYDANGNRSSEESENGAAPQTTTYAYDAADRLTSVTYPDETVAYTLDQVGNRTREVTTVSASPTSDKTLTYDDRDRLTQVTDTVDPSGSATYAYDANGNLIGSDERGVQRALVYDQRDRLVRVTEDSAPVLKARYDWQGRRVQKDGAVGMRKYLWDGNKLLSEHDESGATLTTHYHPNSQPAATPLASFNTAAGWSFLHEDGLGSVVASTALSSAVAERTSYDAWGQVTNQSGFAAHDFGFTAHLIDQETNTLYARARDYDPGTGRFLTEDPFAGRLADPPTQHPYLYARANPTTYVDPSGSYAESGHYYTVLYVALSVGFAPAEAQQLAFFSQLPDEVSGLNAISVQGRALLSEIGLGRDDAGEMRNVVQDTLHALTGGTAAVGTRETLTAIRDAGADLATVGLLLHRLGDSFSHRRLDNEGVLYELGWGHGKYLSAPDKVLRRPALYLEYVRTLVEVLAEKKGLTEKGRFEALSRVAPFGSPYNTLLPRVAMGDRPELADLAEQIVTNYLVNGRRVPSWYGKLDNQGEAQLHACLRSDDCLEDAFEFVIKAEIQRAGGNLAYQPEGYSTGPDRGIFTNKSARAVVDELANAGVQVSEDYSDEKISRAVEQAQQLILRARRMSRIVEEGEDEP